MSGGRYDYAYYKVSDFAYACVLPDIRYHAKTDMETEVPKENLELRQKLAAHLHEVSEIMRQVEWCDSGDINDDDLKHKLEEFLAKLKDNP